ncbi:hypothetical protein CGRA01v4_11807 [Colletotrichum graminicola]|nr:hypothetical protein CGRA01v4_11807 [Colletotrichum graminicola]
MTTGETRHSCLQALSGRPAGQPTKPRTSSDKDCHRPISLRRSSWATP